MLLITINLVPGAVTIQTQPPFDTGKQFFSHYSHNQLWIPLSVVTIRGMAVNTVYIRYIVKS